jgi:hypothetical protein
LDQLLEGDYSMITKSVGQSRAEEITEKLFQPDVLATHEYIENHRRKTHLEPEKNLMFAILEDAVRCYRAYAFSKSTPLRRLYLDAEKWMWKNDWQWAFSFRNICEVLGVDPFCLRRGLLRWKEEQAGTAPKTRMCISRRRAA